MGTQGVRMREERRERALLCKLSCMLPTLPSSTLYVLINC